jgi:hypothetical protein
MDAPLASPWGGGGGLAVGPAATHVTLGVAGGGLLAMPSSRRGAHGLLSLE